MCLGGRISLSRGALGCRMGGQRHVLIVPTGWREWGNLQCLEVTPGPSLPWEISWSLAALRGGESQLAWGSPGGTAQASIHLWECSSWSGFPREQGQRQNLNLGPFWSVLPGVCTNPVAAQCSTSPASAVCREKLFPWLWLSLTLLSCCQWVFLSCHGYHYSESAALLYIALKWRLGPVTTHPLRGRKHHDNMGGKKPSRLKTKKWNPDPDVNRGSTTGTRPILVVPTAQNSISSPLLFLSADSFNPSLFLQALSGPEYTPFILTTDLLSLPLLWGCGVASLNKMKYLASLELIQSTKQSETKHNLTEIVVEKVVWSYMIAAVFCYYWWTLVSSVFFFLQLKAFLQCLLSVPYLFCICFQYFW